jgi:membrane associated rhomboid family serine protease
MGWCAHRRVVDIRSVDLPGRRSRSMSAWRSLSSLCASRPFCKGYSLYRTLFDIFRISPTAMRAVAPARTGLTSHHACSMILPSPLPRLRVAGGLRLPLTTLPIHPTPSAAPRSLAPPSRPLAPPAAFRGDGGTGDGELPGLEKVDAALKDAQRLAQKYLDPRTATPPAHSRKNGTRAGSGMGDGIFSLLIINFAVHIANYLWHPAWMGSLALSHWAPQWWQFLTAAFVHANWEHLLSNAFALLVFGRVVEEEEGAFGVWLTYIICGIGGSLASYLSAPHTRALSLGASSAVFGLFVVGVVTKLRPSAKRLLEAVILGSFVIRQVVNEVGSVAGGKAAMVGGMNVGHWAHLGGAAAGVVLVLLLSRLPAAKD